MDRRSVTTTTLACLGAAYASSIGFKIGRFFWNHWLRPHTRLAKRYSSQCNKDSPGAAWAVVTGATSGIGRACARVLAQQGFHVVLIARTVGDLQELAQELRTMYNIKTMIAPLDAGECSETQVDDFIRQLENKSVAILVNSVGIINERPAFVEHMQFALARTIVLVNCAFAVLLTSQLIPLLKKHASTNNCRAAILNVGSLTSSSPFPLQATYAASKSFLANWSRSLKAELVLDHVDVLCARPGLTSSSRMSGLQKSGGMVADADDFARRALGMLGIGASDVLPYPPHAFLDWLGTIIPERIQGSVTLSMNLKLQEEMERKQAAT